MSRRQRTRSSTSGLIGIIRQDQFGSLWLSLLVLAEFIAKWKFISPITFDSLTVAQSAPCVICIILLLWIFCSMVSVLISLLWWAWNGSMEKGIAFMFVLPGYILGCTFLADYVVQRLVQKLYYRGFISWPEADLSFLLDDMVRHAMGLFLATAVIYALFRLLICKDLLDKKIVIPVAICMMLGTSSLFLIGMKLY